MLLPVLMSCAQSHVAKIAEPITTEEVAQIIELKLYDKDGIVSMTSSLFYPVFEFVCWTPN